MGTNYYARIIPSKKRVENLKKLISEGNFAKITKNVQEMYGEYVAGESEGGLIHLGKKSGGWKFLWNPNVSNEFSLDNFTENKKSKLLKPEYVLHKVYDLTKEGIQKFLQRKDVIITDEYCEIDTIEGLLAARDNPDQDPDKSCVYTFEQFWKLSYINGNKDDLYDGESFDKYRDEMYERIRKGDTAGMSEFTIDSYKYPKSTLYYPREFAWMEKQYGYKLTSYGDFYSDGLRFATSVNFS